MMKLGHKYKHGEGDLATSCNVNMKVIKDKQKKVNKYIAERNNDKEVKFYRSHVVEKMESIFTKRELAFLVQQYSEIIQVSMKKTENIDHDPAIYFSKK